MDEEESSLVEVALEAHAVAQAVIIYIVKGKSCLF